jgi:hypothetical protein
MVSSRVLVDVHRKLAFAQLTSPEGQALYRFDATKGDPFERVLRAVTVTNARIAQRKRQEGTQLGGLSEFEKVIS